MEKKINTSENHFNIPLWEQKPNDSTYYDRELDQQGIVPGRSYEEAKAAFKKKYKT